MDFFAVLLAHFFAQVRGKNNPKITQNRLPNSQFRLASYRHGPELSDSICEWRMRAEEARENLSGGQRLHDHKRGRCWRDVHGNALVVSAEFFERADQAVRVAYHPNARGVRLIFALSGNAHLQQQGGERGENQHQYSCQAAASLAVATTAEPEAHPGDPCDSARDGSGDRGCQDVVVADVR